MLASSCELDDDLLADLAAVGDDWASDGDGEDGSLLEEARPLGSLDELLAAAEAAHQAQSGGSSATDALQAQLEDVGVRKCEEFAAGVSELA